MLTLPIFLCVQPADVRGSDTAVHMMFKEYAYSSLCVPGFKQEAHTYSLLFLAPQPKWRCCLLVRQTHLYHRVLLSSATQQGSERSKWSFVIPIWTSLRLRCVCQYVYKSFVSICFPSKGLSCVCSIMFYMTWWWNQSWSLKIVFYENWGAQYSDNAMGWMNEESCFLAQAKDTGWGKITSINFKVNNKKTIWDTKILFLDSETTTWEV